MGELGDTRGYLELSKDPVRFEPVSKVTNVFFDDTSKEVLSVRGGTTLSGWRIKDPSPPSSSHQTTLS